MSAQGTNAAPLPYRWGKFEGWLLVVWSSLAVLGLGAALLVRVRRAGFEASGFELPAVLLLLIVVGLCAVILLMGKGLLRKRSYALRLVYVRLVLSVLLACGVVVGRAAGLRERALPGRDGDVGRAVGFLALSIPTARYYYRRRHEFH